MLLLAVALCLFVLCFRQTAVLGCHFLLLNVLFGDLVDLCCMIVLFLGISIFFFHFNDLKWWSLCGPNITSSSLTMLNYPHILSGITMSVPSTTILE